MTGKVKLCILVVILLCSSEHTTANELAGCECSRDEIISAVRESGIVFKGQIVRASMANAQSETISLWVQPELLIRGFHSEQDPIVTTRPVDCGVPAGIGYSSLFVLSESHTLTTRCDGSGLNHVGDWRYLTVAVITVAFVESDPSLVEQSLRRISPYLTLEDLNSYFQLIDEIDQYSGPVFDQDKVRYRGLTLDFSGEKFSVSWYD